VAPEKLKAVEIVDKFQAQVGEFGLIIVCVVRPGFRALKVPKANALRDASKYLDRSSSPFFRARTLKYWGMPASKKRQNIWSGT